MAREGVLNHPRHRGILGPGLARRASASRRRCSRSAWLGAKAGARRHRAVPRLGSGTAACSSRASKRIRGAELVTAGELRRRDAARASPRRCDRMPGWKRAFGPTASPASPTPRAPRPSTPIVSGTTGSQEKRCSSRTSSPRSAPAANAASSTTRWAATRRAFFDPARDVLMNPLDARAPRWSPFLEARNPRDFDMMAAALIPQQKDTVDPVLGDGGAPALLQRRRGVLEEGRDGEQGPGRPSPQDRSHGARRGDGRHGRAIHRRSRQPEDRALVCAPC